MIFQETIPVRSNLKITARENGKIKEIREGHNIWVNLGREWLAKLIGYASYSLGAGVPVIDHRVRYMGLGIGGNRQVALGLANASPVGGGVAPNHYAGTNLQTDTSPAVTVLERPVRISWSGVTPTASPYDPAGDIWLGQVAPVTFPVATTAKFSRLFTGTEINGLTSYYNAVPLSEIGLFHNGASVSIPSSTANPTNTYVAYDTFDTLVKTVAIELQFDWEIRF
jgi:hypothetical protein